MGSSIMVIFILLLAATVVAQPADSLETAAADSLGIDSADSLATGSAQGPDDDDLGERAEEDEEEEGPRPHGKRRRALGDSLFGDSWASWLLNTRPDIKLTIDKKKDVTNWDTKINVNRRISSKVRLNLEPGAGEPQSPGGKGADDATQKGDR